MFELFPYFRIAFDECKCLRLEHGQIPRLQTQPGRQLRGQLCNGKPRVWQVLGQPVAHSRNTSRLRHFSGRAEEKTKFWTKRNLMLHWWNLSSQAVRVRNFCSLSVLLFLACWMRKKLLHAMFRSWIWIEPSSGYWNEKIVRLWLEMREN